MLILGAYYKQQTFLYLPANGIVQGLRPLIGYNYGAGEQKRVQEIFRAALALAAGIMLAGTLLSWFPPCPLSPPGRWRAWVWDGPPCGSP